MKYKDYFEKALKSTRDIIRISDRQVRDLLNDLAGSAVTGCKDILAENKKDLDRMDPSDPKYDRLRLTEERIRGIAADLGNVAALPCPVGEILEEKTLRNGLKLKKVRVPLGVVGIVYEARPNVTFDVFALCMKSGNVCLLKGGSDADLSNRAIVEMIHKKLEEHGMPQELVQLLPATREATAEMLNATRYVDVIIPRGGQTLIDFVRQNAKVPVIETGAGIVHTYFDESGDTEKGKSVITNAKLRRVSVCNALDCLIIHRDRLKDLPTLTEELGKQSVEIFADEASYEALENNYPGKDLKRAQPDHFGTEFLSKRMAIKTVVSLDEALDHIARYSSKHSEAIISENEENINRFLKEVDAAAVYANTSTAFTDGAQFELGAEIGISTQKLHARGPMALAELTSYKWTIRGEGQVRR